MTSTDLDLDTRQDSSLYKVAKLVSAILHPMTLSSTAFLLLIIASNVSTQAKLLLVVTATFFSSIVPILFIYTTLPQKTYFQKQCAPSVTVAFDSPIPPLLPSRCSALPRNAGMVSSLQKLLHRKRPTPKESVLPFQFAQAIVLRG